MSPSAVIKRKPVLITINGETHTAMEWSEITGISLKIIRNRYYEGKKGTEIIAPPKFEKDMEIEINGELHTMKEWSQVTGIPYSLLYRRYRNGATAAEFLKPTRSRKERLK